MNDSPANCVVLVLYTQRVESACETGLQELERRGYPVRRVAGYVNIDIAWSQTASDALRDGFEELMWIDADVGFHAEDVDRLREHGLPFVCGVYVKKGVRALSCHVIPGTKEIVFGEQGGLVELKYAATGFLLTHRKVYEEIQEKLALPTCNEQFGRAMTPYFMPLIGEDRGEPWYLAEDFAFCERARQCGYQIWADTTIRLWHYGAYAYSWEDAGQNSKRYRTYRFALG